MCEKQSFATDGSSKSNQKKESELLNSQTKKVRRIDAKNGRKLAKQRNSQNECSVDLLKHRTCEENQSSRNSQRTCLDFESTTILSFSKLCINLDAFKFYEKVTLIINGFNSKQKIAFEKKF